MIYILIKQKTSPLRANCPWVLPTYQEPPPPPPPENPPPKEPPENPPKPPDENPPPLDIPPIILPAAAPARKGDASFIS